MALVQSSLLLKYWAAVGLLEVTLGLSTQTSLHFLTGTSVLAIVCTLIHTPVPPFPSCKAS